MTQPSVILTREELTVAAVTGALQHIANLVNGYQPRWGQDNDRWGSHIEGVAAEMAGAKWSDHYYEHRHRPQAADNRDVADFEVRSTSRPDGCLIIHESDPDDIVYLLVVGRAPVFRVVGWLRAGDGKRPEYVRTPRPGGTAYFVPQSALTQVGSHKAAR